MIVNLDTCIVICNCITLCYINFYYLILKGELKMQVRMKTENVQLFSKNSLHILVGDSKPTTCLPSAHLAPWV